MSVIFRAAHKFVRQIKADLTRQHAFAAERVGFVAVRAAKGHDHLVLLAESYLPVADNEYLDDPTVGARINQEAIRKALEVALLRPVGMFHIHVHDHVGQPHFSAVDLRDQDLTVPDFFKVRRDMPHGAIVLSRDSAFGRCWLGQRLPVVIKEFHLVGPRATPKADVLSRQKGDAS